MTMDLLNTAAGDKVDIGEALGVSQLDMAAWHNV